MTATQSQIRDLLTSMNAADNGPKEFVGGSNFRDQRDEMLSDWVEESLPLLRTILQSALDTQKPAGDADVMARLELLQKRAYSHAEKSNGPKEMREWIDADVQIIKAALNGDCGGGDLEFNELMEKFPKLGTNIEWLANNMGNVSMVDWANFLRVLQDTLNKALTAVKPKEIIDGK